MSYESNPQPIAASTGRRDHDTAYEGNPPPQKPPETAQDAQNPPDDELTLVVAGQRFTGWKGVRVGRGIEAFPSYFALTLTERLPGQPGLFAIRPGQTCRVMIGAVLILTGYIDTYRSKITVAGHTVSVTGRSKTQDLVDCAAGVKDGEEARAVMTFSAPTLLQLATDLCEPFGITVFEPDGEGTPLVSVGDGIPQFTIPLGETVFGVLEPKARWLRRLLIDRTDGNLILATVATGTPSKARSFTLPGNCEEAEVGFHTQERFTIYLPAAFPTDAGFSIAHTLGTTSANYFNPVKDEAAFKDLPRDDGKPRYRPTFVISDQNIDGIKLAEQQANWRKARDFGRSQAVTVTVSTWRDADGSVWLPNTLATVDIPILKLEKLTWVIASVEYRRDLKGTRAIVTLMPPEAFQLEPVLLTQFDPQIAQAVNEVLQRRTLLRANEAGQVSGTAGQG